MLPQMMPMPWVFLFFAVNVSLVICSRYVSSYYFVNSNVSVVSLLSKGCLVPW